MRRTPAHTITHQPPVAVWTKDHGYATAGFQTWPGYSGSGIQSGHVTAGTVSGSETVSSTPVGSGVHCDPGTSPHAKQWGQYHWLSSCAWDMCHPPLQTPGIHVGPAEEQAHRWGPTYKCKGGAIESSAIHP